MKVMKGKIAVVLFLVLSILVVSFSGCVEPEVTTKPNATPTITPTPTTTPTATSSPRGSYQNPADVSETVIVTYLGETFEITVLDVERGETVWQELYAANMFNEEPKQGFEYLLTKVRAAHTSGESSTYVSSFSFNAYAESVGYDSAFVVLPKDRPGLDGVDLMPGGQTEGWICFEVPKNKPVLIAYEYLFEPACFINVGS
ncbi:MAG: DUF4352 domain-containing protein [Methanosarcinales archaeon]|nr:MAG: DUF4352 domain-containing protein [Methanosarcinales archaeon]